MENGNEIQGIVETILEKLSRIIHSSTSGTESYACEICRDTEMVPVTDENGDVRYRTCDCVRRKRAEALLKQSGLEGAIERQTFDSFVEDTPTQNYIKSKARGYLEALLKAREDWNPQAPWFYIGGNPGAGKTHICTAICGELLKKNIGVKYMKWVDEARKLKMFIHDEDFDEMVAGYAEVSVLYIDDLLKQKYCAEPVFTDADIKIAFAILNERYLRNKPTIISSEWDLIMQLLPADEATFTRVYERCKKHLVCISREIGNNYRMKEDAQ